MGLDPALGAAFASGCVALAAQVLLLREYLSLYGGNEVALGAFLSAWLLGIAAGAWLAGRQGPRAARWAAPAILAQWASLLAGLALASSARALSGVPPYEPFPLTGLLAWALPVAVPAAAGVGAAVPALAELGRPRGTSVTAVYAVEALGSLAGGLLATLWFLAGGEAATLALGLGAPAAAGASLCTGRRARAGGAAAAALALAAAAIAGPGASGWLRSRQLASVLPGARLLAHAEAPSGTLIVGALGEQEVLLLDGRVQAAFPDPQRSGRGAGMLAALSGAPRRLLVVGARGADLLPGLLELGALERVVWVPPDPVVRGFVLRHVPGVSGDPRLRVVPGDPVRLAAGLARRGPYDAVWVLAGNPQTRAVARYLSRESLEVFAGLLAPGGVMAIPVESAENYLGPRLRLAVGSVVAGVEAVIGAVRLVPGEAGVVLGSRDPGRLALEPEAVEAAYGRAEPRPPRLSREAFEGVLLPERVGDADRLVAELLADPRVEPPTLDRPLALYRNLLVRASQESPDLARALERLRLAGGVLWVAVAVLGLWVAVGVVRQGSPRVRLAWAAGGSLGAAGGAGLALNLVLLHAYQGRFGTLHLELGWLFALWMAGLAAGGLAGRRGVRARGILPVGLVAFGGLAALGAALALGGTGVVPSRAAGAVAFGLGGALTGAVVPVAEALLARAGVSGARAGLGIEMADHLGAAAAAVLAGVLAVPILGIPWTASAVAGAGAFGAVLVAAAPRGRGAGARYRPSPSPYPGLALLLGGVLAAAVAGAWAVRLGTAGTDRWLTPEELAAAGAPGPWERVGEPVAHHRSPGGDVALASRSAAPGVQGYGGPINLLVCVGPEGTIRRVLLLEHRETPAYLEGGEGFFRSLEGRSILEPIGLRVGGRVVGPPGQAVDAITGATVTSRAVVQALEQVGRRLAGPVLHRPFREPGGARRGWDPRLVYLALSWALVLPALRLRSRALRLAWLAAHVAVGGVWLKVQLSMVQVLSLLRGDLGWGGSAWVVLLGPAAFAAAALLGPVYCGGLCPAGAAQELLASLGLARRVPRGADRRLGFVRSVFLVLIGVAGLAGAGRWAAGLDLLTRVWTPAGPADGLLLALAAAGSLGFVRFWCRYLCPTGAFLGLGARFAPLARLLPARDFARCDLDVGGPREPGCLLCYRCRRGEAAPGAGSSRVPALGLAVALAAGVLLWPGRTARAPAGIGVPVRIERVDPDRLRLRMGAGTLSDHPALYWHRVER